MSLGQTTEDTCSIEISFGEMVHISLDQYQRLCDLISEICDDYESRHPERVMWLSGMGSKMLCSPFMVNDDEPIPFDESALSFECFERERYDTEKRKPRPPISLCETDAIERAIDRMGWPEINAYHAELSKGQDIREDAGGFMLRAIKALFGVRRKDPVTTYQEAARAMVAAAKDEGKLQ